jgi:hypothetical protein
MEHTIAGQTGTAPVFLGTTSTNPLMKSLILLIVLTTGLVHAQDLGTSRTLWRASMLSLATANALDIHSSWGKYEVNRHLADAQGSFGTQGALIKVGMQGSLMGLEYLLTRSRPSRKLYRSLAFINFGASGVIGAVAAHNYTIPPQR